MYQAPEERKVYDLASLDVLNEIQEWVWLTDMTHVTQLVQWPPRHTARAMATIRACGSRAALARRWVNMLNVCDYLFTHTGKGAYQLQANNM
jgi:hypothetical protein